MDIWLYSDETEPNEIRLSDPSGPSLVSVVHSGAGVSAGAATANGSARNRRTVSYAVSYSPWSYGRRPENLVDRMRGNG